MARARGGNRGQLALALESPLALFRLPAASWFWFFVYLGSCAAVLGLAGWLIASNQGFLKGLVLAYLFPESWRTALGFVVDRLFGLELRSLLANATLTGALLLVSILLFPLKEHLSLSFERRAKLIDAPISEFPLWLQAWEEVKLFLAFVAVSGSVFWIGYSPAAWRGVLAHVISTGFLFITFAIDFIAPPLQRHEGCYSRILKTLARRPIATLVFGGIFAAPGLIVSHVFLAGADLTSGRTLAILFATAIGSIAWAAVSGTWLGAMLYGDFVKTRRATLPSRAIAWLLLGGLLLANALAYGAVARAVHRKSQVLKCNYSVAWTSFRVDTPGLSSLLARRVELGVNFELEIENPTSFPVEIEKNRFELRHDGDLVGIANLAPFRVDAGTTVTRRVGAKLDVDVGFVRRATALFDRDKWKITLYVDVAMGFEFPIYLLE